jgi:hypothetical protein
MTIPTKKLGLTPIYSVFCLTNHNLFDINTKNKKPGRRSDQVHSIQEHRDKEEDSRRRDHQVIHRQVLMAWNR